MADDPAPNHVKLPEDAPIGAILARHPLARARVIEARRARGLTRNELAILLGMTRWAVFRIEVGKADPSLPLMTRWAEVLHQDSIDIFRNGRRKRTRFPPAIQQNANAA